MGCSERKTPTGRGFWIWNLPKCEDGDLDRIVARCKAAGITWLALKCGNDGNDWEKRFTPAIVDRLHAGGLLVYGWSYDTPNSRIANRVEVARRCAADGADGFITDCEIEWERVADPDSAAAAYMTALRAAVPDEFALAHSPFDVIKYHQRFPYTALGAGCDFVVPQAYWPEHGTSEKASTERALEQWGKYAKRHPQSAKQVLLSGYSIKPDLKHGKPATVPDMLAFEQRCKAAGCPGVIYWVWDFTPAAVFDGLACTTY